MQSKVEYPQNGVLRLYNQFPRSYGSIAEMTKQLPDIAKMGFNAVWVNPLHPPGSLPVRRGRQTFKGSIYAIKDYETTISPTFGNETQLKEYTKVARENGLIPVFDLVLRHVAADFEFKGSVKKDWFKPYYQGKEMDDVLDFGYVKEFIDKNVQNYEKKQQVADEAVNEFVTKKWPEIFEFWKKYIHHYIVDLGFRGVRIDAIRYLPDKVQQDIYRYIHEITPKDVKQPIIFGELLFGEKEDRYKTLEKLKEHRLLTHITNSLYWANLGTKARSEERWKGHQNDTTKILGELNRATQGGNVGFAGFHDGDNLLVHTLTNMVKAKAKGQINPKDVKIQVKNLKMQLKNDRNLQNEIIDRMKESLAAIAFTSTGGWYLMCGDEYSHMQNKGVFDNYKEKYSDWAHPKIMDLSNFVKEINMTLSQLPKVSSDDWVEHIVLDKKRDLMIVIKHHGKGFDGETSLIVINPKNNSIEVTPSDLKEIATKAFDIEAKKWNIPGNQMYDHKAYKSIMDLPSNHIYLIGNIKSNLSPTLTTKTTKPHTI